LKILGLEEKRNAPFAKLSGGQKQRLFIAMALLPDPKIIFLDELTTGLDPQARHAIWDLVREVRADGKTILLTTHFMEEAERLCDRVAIFDQGKIVALDTPAELIQKIGSEERIVFQLDSFLPKEFEVEFSKTGRVEKQDDLVTIHGVQNDEPLVVHVVNQLAKFNIQYHGLRTEQASLEDVFLKLTGKQMRE
jgi:ABC-2 type transport system ATP-binding protein